MPPSLITSFGTIVYYDDSSSSLRHGPIEHSPKNLLCEPSPGGLALRRTDAPASVKTPSNRKLDDCADEWKFETEPLPWEEFGLTREGVFLSANPDGSLTLDRDRCSHWEAFHYSETPQEVSGMIITNWIEGRRVRFFITNRRDEIQRHLCRGTFYERLELETIRKYCDPQKVCLDVGANIGNHTVYLSKFCNLSKIIPFEPNPAAIQILQANLALNECANVDTRYLGYALGATRAVYGLEDSVPDNLGGTRMVPSKVGAFQALPGDELLSSLPIGFIKIDVEGMEFEVLAGLAQTIQNWRPIIFIEVWRSARQKLGQWLKKNRYDIVWNNYDNFLLRCATGR